MKGIKGIWAAVVFLGLISVLPIARGEVLQVIFTEDFEQGLGDWEGSNGVWQAGTPTAGPSACHEGDQCAGTNLAGNYPAGTDSRLVSPYFAQEITLPEVSGREELHLRYWEWLSYASGGRHVVQISELNEADGTWPEEWSDLDVRAAGSNSSTAGGWLKMETILTAYAGKTIRIGFYHMAGSSTGAGWFIDDIEVVKLITEFTGDFEDGWVDWRASNGVWQVGASTLVTCPGGEQCAGTVLNGSYSDNIDSRLVSAPMDVPFVDFPDQEIRLRYWQWFAYWTNDGAIVQISELEATNTWSEWSDLGGAISVPAGESLNSIGWSRTDVSMTAYAGKTVRIGFYHTTESPGIWRGWYIDDIEVLKLIPEFTGDFEDGWGDWSASQGVWQIGAPTTGPGACLTGASCAATVLSGNYYRYTDSQLVSAPIRLPDDAGLELNLLRFWHWYSFSTNDSGTVKVRAFDDGAGQWLAWKDVPGGGPFSGASGVWSRKTVLLSQYAGKKIEIAFAHSADTPNDSSGWYIDNVRLPGVYMGPCEGDFDNDGDVDGSDLSKFTPSFGHVNCSVEFDFCSGDFDNDGDVDGSDLGKFSEDFGKTPSECFVTP